MNYDNFCPQSRLALNTELMLSGKMNSRRCAIVKADMAQFRRFYCFIFLKVKQAFQSLMIHSNAIICNNNLTPSLLHPPDGNKMTGNTLFLFSEPADLTGLRTGNISVYVYNKFSVRSTDRQRTAISASFQQRGVMLLQIFRSFSLMKQTASTLHRFCLQICIIRYLLLQRICKRLLPYVRILFPRCQ